MIKVEIVADSMHPSHSSRLTTFLLTYPRFVHAEFMTHRMFSRNASSSRAIPVKKQIQAVIDNPAIPIAFLKNKAGMQGGEELDEAASKKAVQCWLSARDNAVTFAYELADLEVHKQYANRILEPWAHISVICTATDYANFFALRIHPAAMPEMQELASLMRDAMSSSVPIARSYSEWHLPFVTYEERAYWPIEDQIKASVARCARVSYLNHEGKVPDLANDMALYTKLLGAQPIHASPAEHQAKPMNTDLFGKKIYYANFNGWRSHRLTLSGQNVEEYVP